MKTKTNLSLGVLAMLICAAFIIYSCKKEVVKVIPTITIATVTDITAISATSGGNITLDGGAPVTSRGVCWSLNQNPTTLDSKTTNGAGIGSFTSSITGLIPGATCYIKAYAINSVGTAYSSQSTFTTLSLAPVLTTTDPSAITATSAISGGNITNDGGASITSRGVCWSLNQNPTIADSSTNDGTGVGIYTSSITGLTPGATYYVKAYATNIAGTGYGNQVSLATLSVVPVLTTTNLTDISSTSANSGGDIIFDGGAAVTARGVCWSINQNPTIADSKTINGTGTGVYTSSITGLTPGSTYYIRAYATNSIGTAYGNQLSVTTTAVLPTLTSVAVTAITSTTATSGGNITTDGGAAVTARGVCWSINQNPTLADSKTINGTGTGVYTSFINGLVPGTNYYLKAYATNNIGTSYSEQMQFETISGNILFNPYIIYDKIIDARDGKIYKTVIIGSQTWMAENLAYLPAVSPSTTGSETAPNYYVYGYEGTSISSAKATTNYATYGVLYNWPAAMAGAASSNANPSGVKGVCPSGWHVPSYAEWTTLTAYLGGEIVAGGKLKETGTSHWTYRNTGASNSSGFTALPGGYRGSTGNFYYFYDFGFFWSSSEHNTFSAWVQHLFYGDGTLVSYDSLKEDGFSVRCVKD